MSTTALATVHSLADHRERAGAPRVVPVDRKTHVQLSPAARERLADHLRAHPFPSKALYADLARRYDVSTRTVETVAAETRSGTTVSKATGGRAPATVPEDALDIIRERQNVKQAWRVLRSEQRYDCCYSNFTRQVNAKWGNDVISAACGRSKKVTAQYLQGSHEGFMAQYTVDLFDLHMDALHGKKHVHPTGMLVREDHTNLIVAAHVFESKNVTADMVASVLAPAMIGYTLTDRSIRLGGLPRHVFSDNGSQFDAAELRTRLAGLGVGVPHSNSYASNENGSHERKHGTMRSQLLKSLPTSGDGRFDKRGNALDTRTLLTLEKVRDLVARWVWFHNDEPAGRDMLSPVQRWQEADEDAPAEYATVREVARMGLPYKKTCQIYGYGVLVDTRHYLNPALSEVTSRSFIVRTWPGDTDHVEVFDRQDNYIGRATYNPNRTAAEEQALLAHRAEVTRTIAQADRQANLRDPHDRPDLPPLPVIEVPDGLLDTSTALGTSINDMIDDFNAQPQSGAHDSHHSPATEAEPKP